MVHCPLEHQAWSRMLDDWYHTYSYCGRSPPQSRRVARVPDRNLVLHFGLDPLLEEARRSGWRLKIVHKLDLAPSSPYTMKLTPELITSVGSSLNPLKDREIDLRGHKVPAIENLGVTRDQVDSLDLTDNDIMTLGNFPHLDRLAHLYLSNNLISRIDRRLAFSIPRLTTLTLTNNQISSFGQLAALARFPMLEYVTLIGNPVAREKYYREYVVWKCKSLRVLDFKRVKEKERELAKSLMETADGRPSSLAHSLSAQGANGDSSDGAAATSRTAAEAIAQNNGAAGRLMTKEERKRLAEAIENSDSLEEIRRLEERLRLGYAVEEPSSSTTRAKRKSMDGDGEQKEEQQPASSPAGKKKKR